MQSEKEGEVVKDASANADVIVLRSNSKSGIEPDARGLVWRHKKGTWQYDVFEAIKTVAGKEPTATFEPYMEKILMQIGIQLKVLVKTEDNRVLTKAVYDAEMALKAQAEAVAKAKAEAEAKATSTGQRKK